MTITRRGFLAGTAASTALLACGRAPLVKTRVPTITHGVQVGDVGGGSAIVWARSSEPARMIVEVSGSASYRNPRTFAGPVVGPDTDHTGAVTVAGLEPGQTIAYRVKFEREADRGASAWTTGTFATPHSDNVRFVWTGDTCGQGYGRNPEWGGLRGYAAMRAVEPAFFLHSGDLFYADNPILSEHETLGGRIWKNVTNERVARVAQELDDFRARLAYNLEDDHVRALAAEVPIIAQWDDHETRNNWWPGQTLTDERYTIERDADKLAALALRAVREWMPIAGPSVHRVIHYGPLVDVIVVDLRTWRTPNDANTGDSGAMLGAAQADWLVEQLATSKARWKIVACDQPIALVIGDGPSDRMHEGYANGAPGAPLGREKELARVLAAIKARGVQNVVWLTADVHYAAHHAFDPARATGADFTPFHELVAGPIHAGTFGPNPLDPTFGPELKFQWAPPVGTGNLAPWDGLQSFGVVDATDAALRVALVGIDGRERYTVEIPALR
ncbi:MAG: alkaline phosphatase D family protein [Kofleriaceae bacterium]